MSIGTRSRKVSSPVASDALTPRVMAVNIGWADVRGERGDLSEYSACSAVQPGLFSLVAGSRSRKVEPLPRSALDRELASHAAREIAADRESQTRALVRARERALELHERLEHRLLLVGGDAAAGVGDLDAHAVVDARGTSRVMRPPGLGELDRVREKVEQNLLDLLRVALRERATDRSRWSRSAAAWLATCGAISASSASTASRMRDRH